MGDYGIRVSKSGGDVRTCADIDTLLTSKYHFFKGYSLATGSVTLTGVDSETVEISHNLGYKPFYQPRAKLLYNGYGNMPYMQRRWNGIPFDVVSAYSEADANKIYLYFSQEDDFGLGYQNTYYYSVLIYKDVI